MTSKHDDQSKHVTGAVAGQVGALGAARQADATDATLEGMRWFTNMWERVKNKLPATRRGHLFEAIVAARENARNAASGSQQRLTVTHLEGHNTAPADLDIHVDGQVVGQAQAKFSALGPEHLAEKISDAKYHGMDRYVPADKVEAVRRALKRLAENTADPECAAEYQDALNHIKDHDTTLIDVWKADRDPVRFAQVTEWTAVIKEAGTAASYGAGSGLVVGGAVSGIKHFVTYQRGEITGKEAIIETTKDAGRAAAKGAGAGAGGALIRYGAAKASLSGLAKSNVTTSLAAGVIDVGVTVLAYAKGEINGEEAQDRITITGVSTIGGIYSGYVAQLLVASNPIAAGASIAGYWVASSVYQACRAIQNEAKLAESEAARIEVLCASAIREIKFQQAEFERLFDERMLERKKEFSSCFSAIDRGMKDDRSEEVTSRLADLGILFGHHLEYGTFSEFDSAMQHNKPIKF